MPKGSLATRPFSLVLALGVSGQECLDCSRSSDVRRELSTESKGRLRLWFAVRCGSSRAIFTIKDRIVFWATISNFLALALPNGC